MRTLLTISVVSWYASQGSLNQRVEAAHKILRNYVCGECGHAGSHLGSLKIHMKQVHLKIINYACYESGFDAWVIWKATLMNILRKCTWRQWICCIRKGWRNTLKESIRRLETLNMNLYLLMHFFRWSFSDWCSISTLLTDMVPNVLMQFINMPLQITLHRHTP